ncbi:MAG: pyruvate:ferredoxin (flavodoxin) oxidoreductase [Rickettsiales bacterium]|jgi:pyruvate-ferredoxin/flavodoxin oxidoreductase|nr:pyruvate:ferredoxin (flavodoxin) oxidoreductase [Rickettsiales bacterium]
MDREVRVISKKFEKSPIDGNEAVARIAYRMSDVFTIYPITPSSPMGELADQFCAKGDRNIFGLRPTVTEMQSEGGAAGAMHGALQTGSLASTFTCSQGLLLMIPNMYKIAGELTPCVMHVAARSLAAQGLSIFGDHQDVMAVRQCGFAMLSSGSVQEAQDMALIAHLATLESRVPFINFFDGFRTSHEINKIELLDDETIKALVREEYVVAQRRRALKPEAPVMRGTAQNPDVYFQGREASNSHYDAVPFIVDFYLKEFARLTGRKYKLFDYYGPRDAENVIVLLGSAVQAVKEVVNSLKNERIGVLQVRLYRPFSAKDFVKVLPKTVRKIAVLDRTKEPGSLGEPLYLDVVSALAEEKRGNVVVVGGRYGLSSKEFTPAMAKGVFDELYRAKSKNHFTVGIDDDVMGSSIKYPKGFLARQPGVREAIFFGLGSDGTVGANKNTIKIICDKDEYYGQAYFVYDSKKSGSITESHLRFGKNKIDSTYLVQKADFVGCHQFNFLFKIDVLERIKSGGILLLNSHYPKDELWDQLPRAVQEGIIEKHVELYTIDAYAVAERANMGTMINTIMQTCFFKLSEVIDPAEAIEEIKKTIVKTYSRKGEKIVNNNIKAVDDSLSHLQEVNYPKAITSDLDMNSQSLYNAPEFVRRFTAKLIAGQGESIKVSDMSVDGTFPTDTAKYEKRNIADRIAVWDNGKCIQCGLCVLSCPHSCLDSKLYSKGQLAEAPACFKYREVQGDKTGEQRYTIQISPEDCTGCKICTMACPVQALSMEPKQEVMDSEMENRAFFETLEGVQVSDPANVKDVQFKDSLFKYSGACAGCGETPYLSLITKLFGDRMIVANATGCSSIYGGNLPTTPWSKNGEGRGPAWSNSLFEDNAEFGLGFLISQETQRAEAVELLNRLRNEIGGALVDAAIENSSKTKDQDVRGQRARIVAIREKIDRLDNSDAFQLSAIADALTPKSIWIVGGDGWAYDIGFGGLDHVLASGKNVNVLVMDTEVYSNTGGQASKATNLGASAKFAIDGKRTHKKDLGAIAMTYGNIYVAQVAIRANPAQTLRALREAEEYDGPSIVIAYSSCIAHGAPLENSFTQQKNALESGLWMLYRYNPALAGEGKNPLQIDSREPKLDLLETYLYAETRYEYIRKTNPEYAKAALEDLKRHIADRWRKYRLMAGVATQS